MKNNLTCILFHRNGYILVYRMKLLVENLKEKGNKLHHISNNHKTCSLKSTYTLEHLATNMPSICHTINISFKSKKMIALGVLTSYKVHLIPPISRYLVGAALNNVKPHFSWVGCLQLNLNSIKLSLESFLCTGIDHLASHP